MPPLIINNQTFEYIKTRDYVPISVYKGTDSFLRIGPKDLIKEEISKHKNLLGFGFPLADIISEGEFEDKYYFIEKSLGDKLIGEIFLKGTEEKGKISDDHFEKFLEITLRFAEAQLNTLDSKEEWSDFSRGIHLGYVLDEFPDLKNDINKVIEKTRKNLEGIPYVISHGDFNAYNLFWDGVIDMEGIFRGPVGFDVVSNIIHTFFFPKEKGYERIRRYSFSKEQVDKYFSSISELYKKNNIRELSFFLNDLIIFRMIWSAARMNIYPKLQIYRHDLLEKMLKNYLEDKPIIDLLIG